MPADDLDPPVPDRRGGTVARIPTGAKLLLFLSAALLPLALIAVFATLQTTRNDDLENRAELRVATIQSARILSIELVGDMTALRESLVTIERDPDNAPSCARARGVLAQGIARGVRFAITDRGGTLRCGTAIDDVAPTPGQAALVARVLPGEGLLLTTPGSGGQARASVFFPAAFLDAIGDPASFDRPYGAELSSANGKLILRRLEAGALVRQDSARVPLGVGDLTLGITTRSAPITSAVVIAMVLPILMWLAAAAIAWGVVDRLLVRPLRRLRSSVADYVPGELFDPAAIGDMSAQEIRELGETFGALSGTLREHEADLAEGLVRQTKLTREVHHRVKNNLQVIASLINFHARSAGSADVAAAYASIQRRVDALAVVHRNHYAELEVNRGLALRPVIGELAASIRATAPEGGTQIGIALEVEPLLVTQDTAVAVTFLITELVELAMTANPAAQLRIAAKAQPDDEGRALLRVSSSALVGTDTLTELIATRYGRVTEGLSRQLRSKLHHDPLVGAFDIAIAIIGHE